MRNVFRESLNYTIPCYAFGIRTAASVDNTEEPCLVAYIIAGENHSLKGRLTLGIFVTSIYFCFEI